MSVWGETDRGESARKLWVHMATHGGRWLTTEMAKVLGMKPDLVQWRVSALARYGAVRRYPVEGKSRRFTYGVTSSCKVPQGLTLGELGAVLRALNEPEPEELAEVQP